jgi:hypothetical protein
MVQNNASVTQMAPRALSVLNMVDNVSAKLTSLAGSVLSARLAIMDSLIAGVSIT